MPKILLALNAFGGINRRIGFSLKICFMHKFVESIKFYFSKGTWKTDGCNFLWRNESHVICSCNHLSTMAVLMEVGDFSVRKVLFLNHEMMQKVFFNSLSKRQMLFYPISELYAQH